MKCPATTSKGLVERLAPLQEQKYEGQVLTYADPVKKKGIKHKADELAAKAIIGGDASLIVVEDVTGTTLVKKMLRFVISDDEWALCFEIEDGKPIPERFNAIFYNKVANNNNSVLSKGVVAA